IMWPVFTEIYAKSFKPLTDGQVDIQTAYTEAERPLRVFMYRQMAHDPSSVRL
ncbi:flagellar biosynthetic protein FliP, partial [Treponema pallidum]